MVSTDIDEAKRLLLSEDIVAIPTETVYGLAASIRSSAALKKVFEMKARPLFDPLIVHIYSYDQISEVASAWPEAAQILSKAFWPGPLTLVVPKNPKLDSLITAGLDTVGIRMPKHPMARALLEAIQIPLAAPSANQFGKVSPTRASHVEAEFQNDLFILDGGHSEVGVESTVVRILGDRVEILRPGVVTLEGIQKAIEKLNLPVGRATSLASPGNLEQHYQPKIPVFILKDISELEILSKKHSRASKGAAELKLNENPLLAARKLYADLRELADSGATFIYVLQAASQRGGAWDAIWDRLERASSR